MSSTVKLPATKRIEGHGRVSLYLDDASRVTDAHFDVTEFRGFETMLEGRMAWEMPLITSRICGVCPVSHHLAAVKAVDALLGVEIPPAAKMLREILHLGGFAQDHALHFFFLAGPDFLLGDGTRCSRPSRRDRGRPRAREARHRAAARGAAHRRDRGRTDEPPRDGDPRRDEPRHHRGRSGRAPGAHRPDPRGRDSVGASSHASPPSGCSRSTRGSRQSR